MCGPTTAARIVNWAQASSWPKPRAFDLGGATRIVQRVVCVGASSAEFCSGRGLNYMQTFTAEATVVDTSSPPSRCSRMVHSQEANGSAECNQLAMKPRTTLE
jgi:hypothetical protein